MTVELTDQPTVALAGNPNSGKTTLFNQLTGANHRIANYPGITVSHTFGSFTASDGRRYNIVDLPGTYSLEAHSPEEEVTQRFILGDGDDDRHTDMICVVVDATNLERNLYLASQLTELSIPTVVALNMMDVADQLHLTIDIEKLCEHLGVPVVPIVAADKDSLAPLESAFRDALSQPDDGHPWGRRDFRFSADIEDALLKLSARIGQREAALTDGESDFCSRKLLCGGRTPRLESLRTDPAIARLLQSIEESHPDIDFVELEIQQRYAWLRKVLKQILIRPDADLSGTDRVDRWILHRFLGPFIMLAVFCFIFVTVFFVASYPMEAIDVGKGWLIQAVSSVMSPGELRSLVTDGVLEGVGAVLVFLPQIILLFFLITILQDFGYMARAAFILDRALSKVGLSGRAFLPLLSSFACAIPGILSTRTIPSRRERFLTIMISPLMVCSARLPVYSLLIAAFVVPIYGAFAGGVVFLGMYLIPILVAPLIAFLFGRTILKGVQDPLILELPAYRRPVWRNIFATTWDRTWDFLRTAGTIILAITIVLWYLASHPRDPALEAQLEANEAALSLLTDELESGDGDAIATAAALRGEIGEARMVQLNQSWAGQIGHGIEPLLQPLGLDWKIGIGLLTSFAAREVFVGTMSTIYGLSESDDSAGSSLVRRLKSDRRADGSLRYNLLTALTLLIFYAFACQCVSTLAVVARETKSWRWPLFLFAYMSVLAFTSAFIVYQGGRLLGFA